MFFLFSKDRFKRGQWCPWCPSHIYKTPPLCSYPITHICHTTPLLLPSTVPFHCFSSVSPLFIHRATVPLFLLCFSSIHYTFSIFGVISFDVKFYNFSFFYTKHYFSTISPLFLHCFSTIYPLFLHYLSTVSPALLFTIIDKYLSK